MKRLWIGMALAAAFLGSSALAEARLKVAPAGAPFTSVQAAVDALPAQGGVIEIAPGVYREKLTVSKAHVRFKGLGKRPHDVVLVWGDASATVGGLQLSRDQITEQLELLRSQRSEIDAAIAELEATQSGKS